MKHAPHFLGLQSLRWLLTLCVFLASSLGGGIDAARAQPLVEEEVPPSLRPWIPWVLAQLGDETCTQLRDQARCVWPGTLELELDRSGGRFSQRVYVERRSRHLLPGSRALWPLQVEVDGKALPVIAAQDFPYVELSPGSHTLTGRFSWTRIPETLPVGENTGLIELTVNKTPVPLLKRDAGQLWLKGLELDPTESTEKEHVELNVFRKIQDGVPLLIETQLVWQVSGKAREIAIESPLLPGTAPLSVEGDLAVALEPSGSLRVQLLPGRHTVTLLARSTGMPEALLSPERAAPWPSQEVWVFEPASNLRSIEITGAPGIDASRTTLPESWKKWGAYSVSPNTSVQISTTRRGEPQLPPNRLSLERELWLDEDAQGFTVRDQLSGTLHQNWRLDLLSGELGQVEIGNEAQVITTSPYGDGKGVEVRDAELRLTAVSRLPGSRVLSAVGWSENVDSLSARLHLPPGWDLFAATGVDTLRDTWISRWNLFSVFYVLVLTLATARLVHPLAGAVAFTALVLSHGEPHAPEYIWLLLIVLSALNAVVHAPRLSRVLRWSFHGVALWLAISILSFSVEQIRTALYPHLEAHSASRWQYEGGFGMQAPAAVAPPIEPHTEEDRIALEVEQAALPEPSEAPIAKPSSKSLSEHKLARGVGDYGALSALKQKQFQPNAIVQTGPGVPDQVSSSWNLTWSGPVTKDHQIRLFLISPELARGLTALRLLTIGLLAYLLFRNLPRPRPPEVKPKDQREPSLASAVSLHFFSLLLAVLFFSPSTALAQEPTSERLEELKTRLTRPASCSPHCLTISELSIVLDEGLTLTAEAHAGATSAYRLPGPSTALSQISVEVDGKKTSELRLESDGSYYLRLTRGVHRVVLRAQLPSDRATLDLGDAPHRVRVESRGWSVSGVSDEGQAGTLTLVREAPRQKPETSESPERAVSSGRVQVAPWWRVSRHLSLHVQGEVITRIDRVSDPSHPEVLSLPLLPGEQVTTAGIDVKNKTAVIEFPREQITRTFTSSLSLNKNEEQALHLLLTSPREAPYTETWTIECGVIWNCRSSGLPTTSHITAGRALEVFSPWPGETLDLRATEPKPSAGQSLTIENSRLTLTPGVRMGQGKLEMTVRTSRSQIHTVRIPAEARLEQVELDGIAQAAKNEGGQVRVSLSPGTHSLNITWQQDQGLTTWFRAPTIDLGAAGVNHRIVIEIPYDRWLLLADGPQQGPALLFWGYLLLIVLAALLLPRVPRSPLRTGQWLLLGLGLTQVPSAVAVFVVAWFFFVSSRVLWKNQPGLTKNFLQLALISSTFLFLLALTVAVYQGLVSSPDMEIQGAGSHSGALSWYVDRSAGPLPSPWFASVSLWVWRAVMLIWALWLARSLLQWLRWAWELAQEDGFWAATTPSQRKLSQNRRVAESDPVETTGTAHTQEPNDSPEEPRESEGEEEKPPHEK